METETDPLTVREFAPDDIPLLEQWWGQRHSDPFPLALLPPLGVVIEDDAGPAGMLWCYECFGVGVGFLEFPVTRPGLSLRQAGEVMEFAMNCCVRLAGKCVEPPAEVPFFRVFTTVPVARFLEGRGFQFCDFGQPVRGMIFHNN